MVDGNGIDAYGQLPLVHEFVERMGGLLEWEGDGFGVTFENDVMHPADVVFRAMLALPADLLRRAARLIAVQGIDHVHPDAQAWTFEDLRAALPGAPAWTLTEAYLQACNREALLELWADAALPGEPHGIDQSLRARLLGEAPKLAAQGFLPRPMRGDA